MKTHQGNVPEVALGKGVYSQFINTEAAFLVQEDSLSPSWFQLSLENLL
jgi:hypothetical protein